MHANDLCDCKKENKDDLKWFSSEQCQKHWTFKTASSLSAYTKCTVCMEVKSVFIVFFCHTRSVQFVSPFIKWLLLSGWSSEAKHFTEKLQKHKGYVFNDYYKKNILFKREDKMVKWKPLFTFSFVLFTKNVWLQFQKEGYVNMIKKRQFSVSILPWLSHRPAQR